MCQAGPTQDLRNCGASGVPSGSWATLASQASPKPRFHDFLHGVFDALGGFSRRLV